jgi:hypothetical protein
MSLAGCGPVWIQSLWRLAPGRWAPRIALSLVDDVVVGLSVPWQAVEGDPVRDPVMATHESHG